MGYLSTVLAPNMDDLAASLDRSSRTMPLSVFRCDSDYRSGLGEMVGAVDTRACPPTGAHPLPYNTL